MKMRALFLALGLPLAAGPALACDLGLSGRATAVADYVDMVGPCLRTLPAGYTFDPDMERDFVQRINEARTAEGLPALIYRPALQDTARFHSLDMAYNSFFGHVGPDGREPQDRVSAFDRRDFVDYSAENVAMIEVTRGRWNIERNAVDRLHRNLMESPGHRANILSEEATHVAIGVVRTETGVWVTQSFLSLSGSLARDLPVRMRAGEKVAQMPVLRGWKFRRFGAQLPDGDYLPFEPGVPGGLSGDIGLAAEGRRKGEEPLSFYTIYLPGPAVTVEDRDG